MIKLKERSEKMNSKFYLNTKYEIYKDGRCFSHLSNKFLTPQMSNKYPTYNLTLGGKKKKTYVHRMVAETFLPHDEEHNIVNHKDGDTHNFNVSNLEWVTCQENSQHACANGLTPKGDQTINRFVENLPNENWFEVKDFPLYIISSYGRIMNHKTKRLLKQAISAHGYYEVALYKNNKGYTKQIHQLVYCNYFQDYDIKGYVINHKDGNKLNNNIDNLEKITYQENNLHAVYTIRTNKCAKAIVQIDKNGKIVQEFVSVAQATKNTGINNISRAANSGRTAGGFYWKYITNN